MYKIHKEIDIDLGLFNYYNNIMATRKFRGGKKIRKKKHDSVRYYGSTPSQYKNCKGKSLNECPEDDCKWTKRTAKRISYCRRAVNRSKML